MSDKVKPTREDVLAVISAAGKFTAVEIGREILEARRTYWANTGYAEQIRELISVPTIGRHLRDLVSEGAAVETAAVRSGRRVRAWENAEHAARREASSERAVENARASRRAAKANQWATAELLRLHSEEFEKLASQYAAHPDRETDPDW